MKTTHVLILTREATTEKTGKWTEVCQVPFHGDVEQARGRFVESAPRLAEKLFPKGKPK